MFAFIALSYLALCAYVSAAKQINASNRIDFFIFVNVVFI